MISIDSHEAFMNPWPEKIPDPLADQKMSDLLLNCTYTDFEAILECDPYTSAVNTSRYDPIDYYSSFNLGVDLNDLDLEKNAYDFSKLGLSPIKSNGFLDDLFLNKPVIAPILSRNEKQYAPLSPDSGIEQDVLNSSFDECADVFEIMEQDKDVEGICEPVKLNNDTELDKFLDEYLHCKSGSTDDDIFNPNELINFSEIINSEYGFQSVKSNPLATKSQDCLNGFEQTKKDTVTRDYWLNEALNPVNDDDFNALKAGLVLQPVKYEFNNLIIKEEACDDNLFVLRNNSQTIQVEHSYYKKIVVIESEEEDEEPVKKRKRNDIDEDFSPYQKPKRKAGRPRTNFSKMSYSQKTQSMKGQKHNIKVSKRTTQAPKKQKSCSSVPFDRREQHNQAERERRDMLKRNLDIVEDITPDHVLHLTQIALQSEKTGKCDEFENNENNFTVDVLKRLDELIKKEPVSHRPKYKKASRNSKMVVLLGSTYYIGSLEKELKSKENRLAQLKKQYEDCLKRLNPTKVSTKRIRRHY